MNKLQGHHRYPWSDFHLAAYRAEPEMWLSYDTDTGGIEIFACPLHLVMAPESTLLQLASDLEFVAWNQLIDPGRTVAGDEAEFHLGVKSRDDALPQFFCGRHGSFYGSFWLGNDITEAGLASQVVMVLRGNLPRVDTTAFNQWLKEIRPWNF